MTILLRTLRDPDVVIKQLAEKLQLSMFDVGKLLRPSTTVPVAAWGYDRQEEIERIWINRTILSIMPDEELMILVKHEVLHRAAYAEGYDFPDHQLANVALDIVINRILHMASPELMVRVCRKIYTAASKETPIGLARADLQRAELPEIYREIWDEVWASDHIPSVNVIYFALALYADEINESGQVWSGKPSEPGEGEASYQSGSPSDSQTSQESSEEEDSEQDQGQMGMFDYSDDAEIKVSEKLTKPAPAPKPKGESDSKKPLIRSVPDVPLNDQVLERAKETVSEVYNEIAKTDLGKGDGFSASFSRFFDSLEIIPQKTRSEEVEDFLCRIRSKEQTDEAIGRLMTAIGVQPQVGVVPINLTATGLFMAGCGVSDLTGVWWNEIPFDQRPKARVYVDTSPSMSDWARRTVYVIDCIKDSIPADMYAFAGTVVPCTTEDFANGKYYSGYSTYFDEVIKDILANQETLAIIFTDGGSSVCPDNISKISASDKEIYTIYMGVGPNDYYGKTLDAVSQDVYHLTEKPSEANT